MSRNDRGVGPLLVGLILLAGCAGRMRDQPRVEPYEASAFFSDGQGSRPLVENTVPREGFNEDMSFVTGMNNGEPVTAIPMPVSLDVIQRGQERYNIYCAPCHGLGGDGDGIIVQRGFPPPPSYHTARLRDAPPGHMFDVITHGFGVMFGYAAQVTPADRWAIVAYVQALQLSRNVAADTLPATDRDALPGEGS